jgi:tetrahydromethanopterin S-methyltransferase subunit G
MKAKSLPAYLQQVLEHHVAESQLTPDDELREIFDRLKNLNDKVEFLKLKIKSNRQKNLNTI